MIIEMVKQWEENKSKLEDWFKSTNSDEFSYSSIVVKLFETCFEDFDIDKMTTIDDGNYQGTFIFIIPKNTYQPCVSEYVVTDTYYGSCSGCDTLESISGYSNELPSEGQVKDYMTLALHLVQKLKVLGEN